MKTVSQTNGAVTATSARNHAVPDTGGSGAIRSAIRYEAPYAIASIVRSLTARIRVRPRRRRCRRGVAAGARTALHSAAHIARCPLHAAGGRIPPRFRV